MKTFKITIENLKCHGCANTIRRNLQKEEGVQSVEVDHTDSSVFIAYEGEDSREADFERILTRLGYPPAGSGNTMNKVKSYVSCAIGRIGKEDEPGKN
jgi:copper chaperone CopZ